LGFRLFFFLFFFSDGIGRYTPPKVPDVFFIFSVISGLIFLGISLFLLTRCFQKISFAPTLVCGGGIRLFPVVLFPTPLICFECVPSLYVFLKRTPIFSPPVLPIVGPRLYLRKSICLLLHCSRVTAPCLLGRP